MWLTVFLFGARGFATGVFQAVYVYTPEVFPTKIRGTAMGLMSSSSRIGGLVTPFVAQVNQTLVIQHLIVNIYRHYFQSMIMLQYHYMLVHQ